MELDVCAGRHPRCQLRYTQGTAGSLQVTVKTKLLGNREHVYTLLGCTEALNGCINLLVGGVIEGFGLENITHHSVGILLKHERTEHRLFKIIISWRHTPSMVKLRHVLRSGTPTGICIVVILLRHRN